MTRFEEVQEQAPKVNLDSFSADDQIEVRDKFIWNAAIEAAAKEAEGHSTACFGSMYSKHISIAIRKLKEG